MEWYTNWALLLGASGAAYAFYRISDSSNKKAAPAQKVGGARVNARQRSASPAARQGREASSSRSPAPKSKKQKKKKEKTSQEQSASTAPISAVSEQNDEPEAASNDQEWAQQLSAARKGINLTVPERNQRQKSPKRQKPAQADDKSWEQQPTQTESQSPSQTQPTQKVTATANDVSDMIEPAAPGPSVLRVTGEAKTDKPKIPQAPAPAKESKKKCQNDRKREEKKLAREEEEKERKALEERQRRSAREARGEPAKNGLVVVSAPTSSAWAQPAKANGAPAEVQSSAVKNAPLLDTFEPDTVSTSSSNEQRHESLTPSTSASVLEQDLPSEETQMQMLNQMNGNTGWNEVTSTKRGKKKNANVSSSPEHPVKESIAKPGGQYSGISTSDLINGPAKVSQRVTKPVASTNGFAALEDATGYTIRTKGHPEDSDWAVE